MKEPNDIIHKFATQGETLNNLKELKHQNERKLLELTELRQDVKDYLEKMKLEGLEAMTRKQFDDMENNLKEVEQKHEKAKELYDKTKKMLLDLQAGVENLSGKLNEIRIERKNESVDGQFENIMQITQKNIVEGLEQSRQKLKILYKDLQADKEIFKEAMNNVQGGGLGGNQSYMFKQGPKGNFFKGSKAALNKTNQ